MRDANENNSKNAFQRTLKSYRNEREKNCKMRSRLRQKHLARLRHAFRDGAPDHELSLELSARTCKFCYRIEGSQKRVPPDKPSSAPPRAHGVLRKTFFLNLQKKGFRPPASDILHNRR